jgi:hypothetical protein
MSSVCYQYIGCSPLIFGPGVFVCSPIVFTHVSPQGPGLPRFNMLGDPLD